MSDFDHIEPTEQEIDQALQRPMAFGYRGKRPLFETWGIGPTLASRDCRSIEAASNSFMIRQALNEATKKGEIEPDSWEVMTAGHFGFGWVEELIFQVIDNEESREPTNVFRLLLSLDHCIQEYRVISSSDYSQRMWDACVERIADFEHLTNGKTPGDWAEKVLRWFYANVSEQKRECLDTEQHEGGISIPEELIEQALKALGWLEQEDEDDD